jgi:hypothetical protein
MTRVILWYNKQLNLIYIIWNSSSDIYLSKSIKRFILKTIKCFVDFKPTKKQQKWKNTPTYSYSSID